MNFLFNCSRGAEKGAVEKRHRSVRPSDCTSLIVNRASLRRVAYGLWVYLSTRRAPGPEWASS
eukprot:scaffold71063_cov47-Attheya_sp.AAC.1